MKATAEYRRGGAVLVLAFLALVPARSGVAQVTSSTSLPATTTTSTTLPTTTSTTVPTGTTLEASSSTTATSLVVLPFDDPFLTIAPDAPVGPTMTSPPIFLTITTVLDLPFSAPFTRPTTTTIRLETLAFSTTTTEPATTTTTAPPTTTTAAPQRLQIATLPAPAPTASDSGSSGAWRALAGVAVLAAAVVAWRRLRRE